LLKGPSVVLADEAHKIKNRTSSIGALVQRFKTNSRIALTGTPLANNLSEYYAMIDWVAPGYLDDPEDFRAFYQQPIEQGTYADSTAYEQRRSLKKLRALMADIAPKVQRKDIKAISKDLQQKTEFVLKCPLTPLQSQAYTAFVETIGTADSKVATVQLFDWMSVLGLLCDHPSTFWHKLQSRNDTAKPARKASRLSPQGDVEQDPDISAMDLPDAVFTRESSIFSAPGINIEHHGTSSKTALARSIIVQATRLGDRVLVFTHYIPVLDYLENMLSRLPESLKVGRLDGKTPMSRRLEMAQAVNNGRLDVMLISTSAGGMGLNITGANRVILMDFGFNPMWEEQAIGRAYRIGQKKEVYVYHLLTAGTHEEKLHQITIYKQQLSQRAVDGKNPNRSAVKVKEMMGAPPTEIEQQDLTTVAGIDSVLDEVLKTKAGREVRSIQTVETLHRETDETLTVEEEHEVATFLKQRKAPKVRPQQAAEMLGGGGGL
jgi:SNF2 family DNA or RNA helicase